MKVNDLDLLIKKSDLIAKIRKIKTITESTLPYNKVIEQSLSDLNDIIKDINETIITIDEMKEYQRTLYLNNWKIRAPNLTFILDKIKIEIEVLNIRFDDFFKLTNILISSFTLDNSPPKYSDN